ncbi:type III-B CRISPR module RAMP protein Cmr4 [Planctomycetales bacterium]|nr:type III-B CRISPR module RAMP protein Cmr4 [Planctomycetales bacterium]GHT00743.1 type III-B CRISPR module RAMP protein Cmr4 [Planctomycetales bacterium]GHT04408.1 type III-B CRISPR module RAMP protein Cmr4 [Planctomycetales bacterium]
MPTAKMFYLHALSPLHVGAGRGLGYIDLPIVREKVTNYPYVPGSSVKGVIRDHAQKQKDVDAAALKTAFGCSGDDTANSGSLVFTDARLLCLPVRSLYGTFAWATSPTVLKRFARDLSTTKDTKESEKSALTVNDEQALIIADSVLAKDQKIYLEDLDLVAAQNDAAPKWADFLATQIFSADEQNDFKQRFVILSDDVFNFLAETGTEVSSHIKIDDKQKTAQGGALWYEEALPAETILAGVVWCDKVYGGSTSPEKLSPEKLLANYAKPVDFLQFGGKATTGKGIVRFISAPAEGGK